MEYGFECNDEARLDNTRAGKRGGGPVRLFWGRILKRDSRGFTLTELMIAMALVGILAALATSSFMSIRNRAKSAEARHILAEIRTMEVVYKMENSSYSDSLSAIGFTTFSQPTHYAYTVTSSDTTSFTVTAAGDIDSDGVDDKWTIDEDGKLTHVVVD